MQWSLNGKLAAILFLINVVVASIFFVGYWQLNQGYELLAISLAVSFPVSLVCLHFYTKRQNKMFRAMETGLLNFLDNDFNVSLPEDGHDEFSKLAKIYNQVGDSLRRERQGIYQRELLLDQIVQGSPLAMILTDDNHRIIFSNNAARKLFNQGKRIDGGDFLALIEDMPASLIDTVRAQRDSIFSFPINEDEELYHFSKGKFLLNHRQHHLYLFKHLTRELNRQEVAVWKKVIRVISHEINNSLAPLSSMIHSGKQLAHDDDRLTLVFNTIADRVHHLNGFIQGYAQFAKLPLPQIQHVEWHAFLESLQQTTPFTYEIVSNQRTANFDPLQMEHVFINLLKNATEAGSPPEDICIVLKQTDQGTFISMKDRGKGMSEQILQNALLPFFSTKKNGTGLGLAICREIIEAHEGRLSLSNLPSGGMEVAIWLPSEQHQPG